MKKSYLAGLLIAVLLSGCTQGRGASTSEAAPEVGADSSPGIVAKGGIVYDAAATTLEIPDSYPVPGME